MIDILVQMAKVVVLCAHCGSGLEVWPYQARRYEAGKQEAFYHPKCKAIAQRKRPARDGTRLTRFLEQEVLKAGSIAALATQIGLPRRTLGHSLEGMLPAAATYERLLLAFTGLLPESTLANDVARARAKEMGTKYGPGLKSAETQRKAALARRGLKRRPEVARKVEAARQSSGAAERATQALMRHSQSDVGVALRILGGFLRQVPNPTKQQLAELRARTVKRFATEGRSVRTDSLISAIWRPVLTAHGLRGRGGRRLDEERHEEIDRLKQDWPRDSHGHLRRGFWPSAATQIVGGFSADYLQSWYNQHSKRCTRRSSEGEGKK